MYERVLIIDDSQEIRDFLSDYILKPKGFEVLTASNGLMGLEMAIAKEPDLMIVDQQMPRLTGLEVLEKLQERGIEIPAILATAHGSEETAVQAFRLGIRDYVIKPFDADEISDALASDQDAEEVAREATAAKEAGIEGVPCFIFGGKFAVSGAQAPEHLAEAIERTAQGGRDAAE